MNTDSYIAPVWQLPVNDDGVVPKTAKYHCFVQNKSLCGRKMQDANFYDDGISRASDKVEENADVICRKCFALWRSNYCPNCGAKMDGGSDDVKMDRI